MASIVDYVRDHGQESFLQRPLGDIDAVILSELAYLDFEFALSHSVHGVADFTSDAVTRGVVAGTWNPGRFFDLLRAMWASPRFHDITWSNYLRHIDPDKEQEFTAVTVHLPDASLFVSFRGTTATLLDWKEDFNMTYMQAVPSQSMAVTYVERIARRYHGSIVVGGHSKGGNLAAYVMANVPSDLSQRIVGGYNIDGPGLKQRLDASVAHKIHKLIPESSLVGLLLEPETRYTVVRSTARGISQHDPLSWVVEGTEFVTVGSVSRFSRFTEDSIARWLEATDDETKQEFLTSVFGMFMSRNYTDLSDITANKLRSLRIMGSELRSTDPEVRRQWRTVTSKLVLSLAFEARKRVVSTAGVAGQSIMSTVRKVRSRGDTDDSAGKTVESD